MISTKGYLLVAAIVAIYAPADARIVFDRPVAQAQGTCTVADPTGTMLNVRTAPSTSSGTTVDKLENGTVVQVFQQQDNWAFVRTNDNSASAGWVYSPFLNSCRAEAQP